MGTQESFDTYHKHLFLRSRYYSTDLARFLTRDTYRGDYNRPQTLNGWAYALGNPVGYKDPTGMIAQSEEKDAYDKFKRLQVFGVYVNKDWGFKDSYGLGQLRWEDGSWELGELTKLLEAIR